MFGIIADLFSSVLTILFPIFASYKALRSSDPYQLAPWLMYWVVLSAILMAESWTYFIIGWFPFYSWIRLTFFAYLVLPQTQGARTLYQEYVDPFLAHHEREIEDFISTSHERAKALGLEYLQQAIDWVRERVLGLPPQRPPSPPPSSAASYAQSLLSRFTLPSAVGGTSPAPANDWYSAISSAVASVTSPTQNREVRAEQLSASGSLLPREMASMSRAEKASFYSKQRDMLDVLRDALAKEESSLDTAAEAEGDDLAYGGAPLRKNRSDNSFHHIEHEDTRERSPSRRGGNSDSGWLGGSAQPAVSSGVEFATRAVDAITRAREGGH
ncbi:TB2/DP1, HVA22 family-domain-containing protein [Aspergillus egyptiacus]|nr:TB2/DP1, HVA22 family-domain-containing protein [Aspergillus egyptiacus]